MSSSELLENEVCSGIPKGWHETTLGQLVTFHRGYDLPLKDTTEGPYPIVGSNGIIGYHNSFKMNGPGVIIGRSGNLGKPFFVKENYWPHNTSLYVAKFHNSDPSFIYYFLKTLNLAELNAGSAVPTLNRNHIHTIDVIVPKELMAQKAIGEFLSRFDSKIKTNQQMNKTLETIGQAVFKRWFVDFEFPNEEDKPYKSNGGDMFYNEEIGKEIPQGFRIGDIYELCEVTYGYPFSAKYFNRNNIGKPLIRIRDLKTLNPDFYTTEENSRATLVRPGDIVAGMDAEFVPYIWLGEVSYLNQRVCMFRPKNSLIHQFFIYQAIKPLLKRDGRTKVGTTVIHLGKSDIDLWRVVIAHDDILAKFRRVIEPIFEQLVLGSCEIRNLSQIRDLLLPKLMLGKIRVCVQKENAEVQ
jgi:type I restriction enzyme S subunit